MTHFEKRLKERSLKLLNEEVIDGAHSGNIYRIDVLDEVNNQTANYIYKEFAADRNNEIDIYTNLADYIKPFSKLVKVWDSSPQAILMEDLKSPIKETFNQLPLKDKKNLLEGILHRLSVLHSSNYISATEVLPIHQINSEWRDWCLDQLKRLCSTRKWAKSEWVHTIDFSFEQLEIMNHKYRCPLVITHGDPHMENIFYHKGQVWFIDWEWAAMGSPLRDITILLQDLYDIELIQYVEKSYRSYLHNEKIYVNNEDYNSDFNYLYIDHTTMMLAWEIEKYIQGYTSEERIREIIDFKIGEINRTTNEEMSLFK